MHHINGEGEDAGVVYCEMQARENTSEDRTHFHLVQHMYPGHCGYKVVQKISMVVYMMGVALYLQSETGGCMDNLRTSCCNEKV